MLFAEAEDDLAEQARALLREWGPVQVGTPSADFDVAALEDVPGWLVTCHHPDIVTYVGPEDGVDSDAAAVMVGLLGRAKRHQDAEEQAIIHVEDARLAHPRAPGPEPCPCLETPYEGLATVRELGADARWGEATLLDCRRCGRTWLRYFYELEAFSRSGRWYLGVIAPEQARLLRAADARALLESLPWYYCGGSYYGGRVHRTAGKLNLV